VPEGTEGGIIDRRASDKLIVRERRGGGDNRRLSIIVDDVRCLRSDDVGHDLCKSLAHLQRGEEQSDAPEDRSVRERSEIHFYTYEGD
jgi:hypothetical protein